MRSLLLAAVAATALFSAPALAQDTAPDGTRAFGIEPYLGVMGGWEQFDNEPNSAHIPQIRNSNGSVRNNYRLDGALVEGVVGANIPLGPVFVGAEGNVAKSVQGDLDWEYGVSGRFGFRAGDSGLFYGKVGYEWVNFNRVPNQLVTASGTIDPLRANNFGDDSPDYNAMTYGIGAEIGPKDIGLGSFTHNAGIRLRGEVSTFGDAHSFRPMAGIITHF